MFYVIFDILLLFFVGKFIVVVDRNDNADINMEPGHHPAGLAHELSGVAGKPVKFNGASVDDTVTHKSAARSIAATSEAETNGKFPEQLEMMIVKDGIPPVHHARDFDEVLSLGCDCRDRSTLKGNIVMVIMLLSNMLNYMDRFTIVGMLTFALFIL